MPSDPEPSDLVQGTIHMLILKTLALEPMHGCGIRLRLEQISRGVFRVNAGSLFPALRQLKRDGLIRGEWQDDGEQPPRKVLQPDHAGQSQVEAGNARVGAAGGGDCQDSARLAR